MRPFEKFTSIRAKLGAAIVAAVAVTILVLYTLLAMTLPGSMIVYDQTSAGLLADTAAFLAEAWWLLILAGALAAIAALLFVRMLARGMTKPLRQMAAATAKMARGDYSERVHTASRDEVGRLADAFNNMAAELEHVDRLRRDLVANVSHELKTPIAAIRAHLENLLEGVEQPDPATIELMLRQSERLSALVEQVLDLSRLESGTMVLDRQAVSLAPVAEQVVAEVDLARNVRVRTDLPASLAPADADRQRIHQVLYNLLDNAARYSADVTLTVHERGEELIAQVDDNGPGIPAEQLSHVFERFYRADAARSRADGGAGLGLAIARSIVEAHGGRIWAERRAPSGMRFSFTLPACRIATAAGAQSDRRRTVAAASTKEEV